MNRLRDVAARARQRADAAYKRVQDLREKEAQATEAWQQSIAVEDRAREEQFRREVAAANADPDTYAPGIPNSQDPVRQVSVSVIGEGLIQLRGPMKGINVIRTMINQIDAPVGQVRVGVHTVQINGEKGDRMEIVAGKIQRYIDHSRFLTLQSAEMLRKAIVQVAAMKATELGDMPGLTQDDRDRKYLYAFFGEDFIRELEVLDSEFLMTGNKLLSIHSMDSTSLASAMFILALAKNSTRMEILQRFEEMVASNLVMAEHNYFEAGVTCDGKKQLFTKHGPQEEFQLLSQNARFQSIRGMFDVEIGFDDTMTPIQREFVRLAQIFKSRLIVEMELRQRVMERAVIEERLGDRRAELLAARQKDEQAKGRLEQIGRERGNARKAIVVAITEALAQLAATTNDIVEVRQTLESYRTIVDVVTSPDSQQDADDVLQGSPRGKSIESSRYELEGVLRGLYYTYKRKDAVGGKAYVAIVAVDEDVKDDANGQRRLNNIYRDALAKADYLLSRLRAYTYVGGSGLLESAQADLKELRDSAPKDAEHLRRDDVLRAAEIGMRIESTGVQISRLEDSFRAEFESLLSAMSTEQIDFEEAFLKWRRIRERVLRFFNNPSSGVPIAIKNAFDTVDEGFRSLSQSFVAYQLALREAELARRPLDHKKFLDMLVDEMEDKYIELLEGTRAHVANIDAYIKRLMTSLDDDFNTQFYYPTFRKVRTASQLWDVQMGQVESTNVLANNRGFAKVSPEATMEFDLPKRDILIAEAMNGAKAAIDDFGALAQDPTFLL